MNKSKKSAIEKKKIKKNEPKIVENKLTKVEKKGKTWESKSVLIAQLILLGIVEIVFCFTFLGDISIIPGALPATTAHLPVIIAALFLGKKYGVFMGGIMGISSIIYYTIHPQQATFVFVPWSYDGKGSILSLLIAILPCVSFPVAVSWLYNILSKKFSKKTSGGISAFFGSIVRSALLFVAVFLVFWWNGKIDRYELVYIFSWSGFNVVFEAIVATIIGVAAVSDIGKNKKKRSWKFWKKKA